MYASSDKGITQERMKKFMEVIAPHLSIVLDPVAKKIIAEARELHLGEAKMSSSLALRTSFELALYEIAAVSDSIFSTMLSNLHLHFYKDVKDEEYHKKFICEWSKKFMENRVLDMSPENCIAHFVNDYESFF